MDATTEPRSLAAQQTSRGLLLLLMMLTATGPVARNSATAMGSDTSNLQLGFVLHNVLFLREHNRIARLLAGRYPGHGGRKNDTVGDADARCEQFAEAARLAAHLVDVGHAHVTQPSDRR